MRGGFEIFFTILSEIRMRIEVSFYQRVLESILTVSSIRTDIFANGLRKEAHLGSCFTNRRLQEDMELKGDDTDGQTD